MKVRSLRWVILLVAAAVLLATMRFAGDAGFWRRYVTALAAGQPSVAASAIEPRVIVRGGGAVAMPRASAETEGLAPEAVAAALAEARGQRAQALIVHRHGHRIAEHFADSRSADSELAGGDLSPMPLALALGSMVDAGERDPAAVLQSLRSIQAARVTPGWRNPWSGAARHHFSPRGTVVSSALQMAPVAAQISQRVWQPLGAGDAAMWAADENLPRLDCCFVARVDDWMRIGDLLLQQGQYGGERIVSAGWIRELLVGDTGPYRRVLWRDEIAPWTGDEPPAARDVAWVDLGPDVRLWLLPQRGLAVLHWSRAGSSGSQDTALLNVIIRGIVDQIVVPTNQMPLDEMIPGH